MPVLKDSEMKGAEQVKITLEPDDVQETEVIIRGDVASEEVAAILQLLGKKSSGKVLAYREDEQFIVDSSEIVFLETTENRVWIHTSSDSFEAKQKLYELKQMLAGFSFAQISKSTIVNINCVKSIQAEFSGNYLIKLKNRKEVLGVSRKYFKEFKDRI